MCDMQIGDMVTFKNRKDGASFIDIMTRETINKYYRQYFEKELEILKIGRPVYEVVEEKKELLTEEEREYLSDTIRPFRDRVKGIEKREWDKKEYIYIYLIKEIGMSFPYFEPNTMYKNMKLHKEYSLKELGLEEN